MGNTQIANPEALSIQETLRRHGKRLEHMFKKLKYKEITVKDAYEIQQLLEDFYALEPRYKGETVKTLLKKIATAINIWEESTTTRQDLFYDHMEAICPSLKSF